MANPSVSPFSTVALHAKGIRAKSKAADSRKALARVPFSRVFLIVLDSVGVGELPDAGHFGDRGSNTLGNIAAAANGRESLPDFGWPKRAAEFVKPFGAELLPKGSAAGAPRLTLATLQSLGIANIIPLAGIPPVNHPRAFFGKMAERSAGKDTTSGHWEMMGVIRSEPSRTYPDGFPAEMVKELEAACGTKFLLNKPYSGTEALKDFGQRHCETKMPILYTSADSVLQIAAHTTFIPVERLYEMCEAARAVAQGKWLVDRVIARPFRGGIAGLNPLRVEPEKFERAHEQRKDYSIMPPRTYLNELRDAGVKVTGVGKIGDIFAGSGLDDSIHTEGNADGMKKTMQLAKSGGKGFYFINLVDFDSKYGHRNDPAGYAAALEDFDSWLGGFLQKLKNDDLLLIAADHGNDPTTPSTDHSREYVPLIAYVPSSARVRAGSHPRSLGVRESFADLGATVCENFGILKVPVGASFLSEIIRPLE
ncbi:MAG: phosphopentomutase [bacterium]|jgi:phosphopentomutase